jgi:biopolymer transport protein ExbB
MTLLQIAIDTSVELTSQLADTLGNTANIPGEETAAVDTLSLIDLILKGGLVMVPMAILSVLTIYYAIERLMYIKGLGKVDDGFMGQLKKLIQGDNLKDATDLCNNSNTPVGKMLSKGISRIGKPLNQIEEAMENTGKLEINKLEKNMGVLMLIGRIAPILGFVGTIVGVIKIFYDISLTDNISIGVISGGLYQKMITSASGLIIGLTAFIAYFLINAMIDKAINRMESSSIEFMDILHEPAA